MKFFLADCPSETTKGGRSRPFRQSKFRVLGLCAGVLVEAAPVDGLGPEIEPALDFDPVHIEPVAGFDVGALLALQISWR
jgi:hypothetical protein